MDKDLVISVIAPIRDGIRLNEFIKQTARVLSHSFRNYEIILVDHGCSADTARTARTAISDNQNIRLIILSKPCGRHITLTAGLDHSIGDYVVLMSANLSDPPRAIPELVSRTQAGVDVVYAVEDRKDRPADRVVRLLRRINPVFQQTGVRRSEFVALSRRAVNALTKLREQRRFIDVLLEHVGSSVTSIKLDPSQAKRPRRTLIRGIRLELDALIAFSNRPLRYVSLLSPGIAGAAMLAVGAVVAERLINDQVVEGWTSLMAVLLGMFCILFLFLAVISEYIARILSETKNRPLYYVREEIGGTRLDIGSLVEENV